MQQTELSLEIEAQPVDGVLDVEDDLLIDDLFDSAIGRVRSQNSSVSFYSQNRAVTHQIDGSIQIELHLTEVNLTNVSRLAFIAAIEDALEYDVPFVETGEVVYPSIHQL